MADFDPDKPEEYAIPRDRVRAPPELTRLIWPQMDAWQWAWDHPDDPQARLIDREKASGASIHLMLWLREVMLQDAVFFIKKFADHPIFQHPAFRSPAFKSFARQVEDACESCTNNEAEWERFRESNAFIYTVLQDTATQLKNMRAEVRDGNKRSLERIERTASRVEDLCTETIHLTLRRGGVGEAGYEVSQWHMRENETSSVPHQQRPRRQTPEANGAGAGLAIHNSPANSKKKRAPGPKLAAFQAKSGTARNGQRTAGLAIPQLDLPDWLATVEDLRRCWREGLGTMPSVDSLERKHGAKWRPAKRKMYFSIRKRIVDEMASRARTCNCDEKVAAAAMDEERGQRSLAKYSEALRRRQDEQE